MQKNNLNEVMNSILQDVGQNESLFSNPSVDNGSMGVSLLYFYAYKFYDKPELYERGVSMIRKSIKSLSQISEKGFYHPSYKGDNVLNAISSFGKGLLFTENRFNFGFDFNPYYRQLDEVLLESLNKQLQLKDFDYFSGALAPGHYFINRYFYHRDEYSKIALLKIYRQLKEAAVTETEDTAYWHSRTLANKVYLGISHGSAMIINFLCKLFELRILSSDNDRHLLTSAVNFVLRNRRAKEPNGYFPDIYTKNTPEVNKTQFAMCYGDLGLLYTLFSSSYILGEDLIGRDIERMLFSYSTKLLNRRDTYDAGILYGASGVHWLFREISEKWHLRSYDKTAKYWYDQIFEFRDACKSDNAGFLDIYSHIKDNPNRTARCSFLWGICGIGITLMAGHNKELPKINELTLLGV